MNNRLAAQLNPENLSDIAAILSKSDDEQLWFFLKDCIPCDKKNIRIIFLNGAELTKNGDISNAMETTSAIVDRLFFGDNNPEALEKDDLTHMAPYLPMLKHCYQPYSWQLFTPNLTKEQKQNLRTLIKRNDCVGTTDNLSNPSENAITIPAIFTIQFGTINQTVNGWLFSLSDRPNLDGT